MGARRRHLGLSGDYGSWLVTRGCLGGFWSGGTRGGEAGWLGLVDSEHTVGGDHVGFWHGQCVVSVCAATCWLCLLWLGCANRFLGDKQDWWTWLHWLDSRRERAA